MSSAEHNIDNQQNKRPNLDKNRRLIYAFAALLGAGFTTILFFTQTLTWLKVTDVFLATGWLACALLLLLTKISTSTIEVIGFSIILLGFVVTDVLQLLLSQSVEKIYLEVIREDAWVFFIFMSLALIFFKMRTAVLWNMGLGFLSTVFIGVKVIYLYYAGDASIPPYRWFHFMLIFSISTVFLHMLAHFKGLASKLELEAKIAKQLAYLDALTNLPNRRAISEILELEIQKARAVPYPLCIALIDIDRFKNINDTYGHLIGDKILQEVSEVIKNHARSSDFQNFHFGRWGGEEFLYVLPKVALKQAYEISERLRKAVSEHSFHSNLTVTLSFGVTSFSQEDNLEKIVNRADEALYTSKTNGRNRVSVLESIEQTLAAQNPQLAPS